MNAELDCAQRTPRVRPVILVLMALLGVPASAVGESDFPDAWSEALTVDLGTYKGDVGSHDPADWLRFELPEGWGLHADVTGEAEGFVWLDMYADDGHPVASWGLVEGRTAFSGGSGAVRFGIRTPSAAAFTYSITFTATLLPDVRMENLTVTGLNVPLPTGHTFTGIQQVISFDLVNRGQVGGSADAIIRVFPASNPIPRPQPLAYADAQDVYVPAGETVHVTFTWTSWRVVGDFAVYALADMNGHEVDPIDNSLATRGSSILAGTGTGVDLGGPACTLLPCGFISL